MPVVIGIYFVRAAVKLLTTPAGPRVYTGTPGAQLIPYSTPSCHSYWKNWNNTFWDLLDVVADVLDIGNECLWRVCGCSFKLKLIPYSIETYLNFWSAYHIFHFMGFHAWNVFLWLHSMGWKMSLTRWMWWEWRQVKKDWNSARSNLFKSWRDSKPLN